MGLSHPCEMGLSHNCSLHWDCQKYARRIYLTTVLYMGECQKWWCHLVTSPHSTTPMAQVGPHTAYVFGRSVYCWVYTNATQTPFRKWLCKKIAWIVAINVLNIQSTFLNHYFLMFIAGLLIGLRRIQKTEFEYSSPKILFKSEYSHYIYV